MWAPVFLTQSVLTSFPFRKASLKACHDDSLQICAARAAPHPARCRGPAASARGDVMSESIRGNLHSGGKKKDTENGGGEKWETAFFLCALLQVETYPCTRNKVCLNARDVIAQSSTTAAELTSAGQELFGASPQHCEAPSALL